MKMRSTLIVLLSSVAVVTLAHCNRGKNKVSIEPAPSLKNQKAQSCRVKLGSQEIRVDTEKITVSGQSLAAPLCALKTRLNDYTPYTSETGEKGPAQKYQLTEPRHRRYTVGKSEGGPKAKVALKLGVDFMLDPNERSANANTALIGQWRKDAFDALKNDCLGLLKGAWDASNLGVDLDVHLYRVGRDSGTEDVILDQTIVLAGTPASPGLKSPRFVLANWPTYGQLFTKAENENCDTTSCGSQTAPLNRPFCARLARLLGQFLGLRAVEASSEPACGAHHLAEVAGSDLLAETAKPTATPPGFLSFDPAANDFWEKARFSQVDLKAIIGPACSGQVIPVPKTKVGFADPTPVRAGGDDGD